MITKFKLDKFCWNLSLSVGCLLFGFFELIGYILVIIHSSIFIHNGPSSQVIPILIGAVIGFCTGSLMICGSKMENRWLLLPHLAWELLLFGSFAIGGLVITVIVLFEISIVIAWMNFSIMCCISLILIYYWSVMYSRYLEIKEKQSPPPYFIEMQ